MRTDRAQLRTPYLIRHTRAAPIGMKGSLILSASGTAAVLDPVTKTVIECARFAHTERREDLTAQRTEGCCRLRRLLAMITDSPLWNGANSGFCA